MEIFCTRPHCANPSNHFSDLDDKVKLTTAQQKYCRICGMPLILAGRYLPIRLLGEGGFGAAFLARDRHTPTLRECVVKQFKPSINLQPSELALAQELFEREATVLEQLGRRHPQIPDLYAYFPLIIPNTINNTEEQFFYLVQEFIDGETLEEQLAKKGKFSEAETQVVLKEMLNVLKFVHDNNSIHRDIKPSNIMSNRQGLLYLLDFGAVKQVTNQSLEQSSTGVHTPGFAPPEQMAGKQIYPSTDLYALAVTCINLLTGKQASDLFDPYENKWEWHNYAPKVSDRLANILDTMLKPKPEDRFQSAAEIINEISYPTTFTPPVTEASPSPPPIPVTEASASPIQKQKSKKPPKPQKLPPKPLSVRKMLSIGGLIGFETTLVFIASTSFLLDSQEIVIPLAITGGFLIILTFLSFLRWLESLELLFVIMITAAIIWIFPQAHDIIIDSNLPKFFMFIFSLFGAGLGVLSSIFMRILYKLLTSIF